MNITPTINVKSKESARDVLIKIARINPAWVQFDVSDGIFSEAISWNEPEEAINLVSEIIPKAYVEAHLMVQDQKKHAYAWIDAGVRRVIIHIDAIDPSVFFEIQEYAEQHGVYCMAAITPATDEHVFEHFGILSEVFILSVQPGPSGQKFKERMKERIRFICDEYPNAYIEVDGGVTPSIARQLERIGVDCVAVGAYLSSAPDVVKAFQDFQ